jgi:hypothetical protein
VTGTAVTFGGNAPFLTVATATATCSSGTLVAGGGIISNNSDRRSAALTASYPSSTTVWTVEATLLAGSFTNGQPPTLTPYAVCAS